MLKREKYLSKIREFYDLDLIKVIMGIRRCGKSVLLKQIIEELKEKGIKTNRIIYINFEDVEYSFIKSYMDLIDDNYPKYVISTDKLDYSQNGIIHKNIIDWLLED